MKLKSILRYPGGKSRAIKNILPMLPANIREYREPMVGGGALFLYLKQSVNSITRFHINDINPELQMFWLYAKNHNEMLVDSIHNMLSSFSEGRELFYYLRNNRDIFNEKERAARYFILNRSSFSGVTEAGGFSASAFEKRMNKNAIKRLEMLAPILENTIITCGDYEKLLFLEGDDVFIFFDPPYYSARNSKLYGVNGTDHISFNYERLAKNLKKCSHNWLMTIDDSPYIRELFGFAQIEKWSLQYGMNNVGGKSSERGKELFVYNYHSQNSYQPTLFNE